MAKGHKRRSTKAGLSPGTPVHIGEAKAEAMHLTLLQYSDDRFQERDRATIDDCLQAKKDGGPMWVVVRGLHQVESLQQLAAGFGLHPLVIEDVVNTEQRSKLEDYGDYLFLVVKRLLLSTGPSAGRPGPRAEVRTEQVSLILGPDYVLSFQEGPADLFHAVQGRLRNGKGRIRTMGCDYLAYSLLDSVVDEYFSVVEQLDEEIEGLEDAVVTNPVPETVQALHRLKKSVIVLRKAVWPLREVVGRLERAESPLIKPATVVYLRDVYDHTIQVIETTETLRDMLAGMLDIYLTSLSNRLNETMKVLTVIATLFIPLTFIVGIYGMNFTNMPELAWPWGYPLVWLVMLVVAGGMLVYFRRRSWL